MNDDGAKVFAVRLKPKAEWQTRILNLGVEMSREKGHLLSESEIARELFLLGYETYLSRGKLNSGD